MNTMYKTISDLHIKILFIILNLTYNNAIKTILYVFTKSYALSPLCQ